MSTCQPAAHQRGIHLVSHETPTSTAGITCPTITPRRTEWLPDLLATLRSHTEATIRNHTTTDSYRTSSALCARLHPEWTTLEKSWSDDTAEAIAYTHAITTLATTYHNTEDLSTYHQQRQTELIDTVESIGTGRGPVNAGLGALAKGPVALHRALDAEPQAITLMLDGEAWTTLEDRRTGVRALATIAVLAHGFDIRLVVSPTLQHHLTSRYPQWTDVHLERTDSRERSPQSPGVDRAWNAIRELDSEPGKRRLLTHLPTDHGVTYAELAADAAIDIAAGTVNRYVLDLEARGLVTITRHRDANSVSLTPLGVTAVSECLDDADRLIHPAQRQLDGCLTTTPHDATSTVSPRRGGTPIDGWVPPTGDTEKDAEYVQWLTDPDTTRPTPCHQRFSIPADDDSITLVDDPIEPFEDGRVAYLSHTETDTLVMLQWGGPLATLGRLAATLLSEKALDQILTPARLGEAFETLNATAYDTPRLLRRGHQVGWYSDDEATYDAWRARITTVRNRLLTQLAELTTSDDTAARSELFEDLHGLIASVTQLYHAAGIDLTTTLRLPDTDTLARNPTTRQNLCEFLAKTVPKQSVCGIHSGYRMLFEDRPPKLCRRLPYDADATDHLKLTMSWVLAGPTITDLHADITATLQEELTTVREAIAAGTEQAPTLTIPVRDATTYPAIRRVIDEVTMTHDIQWTARERQRLVRRCLRSFGPADTHQACPYDVVVSLLRALSESPSPTPADIERAAATLPPERFRPDLKPTATKLYATLLRAEEPLGRTELIERADISASSYDRRIGDIRALDRVQPVQVDGHRRWIVDESSSISPGSWWPPSVKTPPHSTPLTHRPTTHTRANGVATTRWLQTHGHSALHTDTGSRHPTSTATDCDDTSVPLNLRSCYRSEHMLQHHTHPTTRSRAQPLHHTGPRTSNPTMKATQPHPTTAQSTLSLHPNQWGERQ